MALAVRRLALLLCATLCISGCWGGSQNPSYFPYLLPTGDIVRTHAKPIGPGYYANFDPHAVDLAVEPQTMTSQVGSQVVILATVRDEKGVPRRQRRVEWKVTNGNLIEVDEAGCLPGRGGVDGNTAWSFTAHDENRISRGNANKADDIMVRPGQTWCVVSSPVEGDTHVQVVVPGIFNWDKRMKTTVVRWVDAVWEFPPRAVAKFGTEHEFVTKISKFTTREPLAKYRVRYKILDGPPAVFVPSRTQEQIAISDLNGVAKVKIAQLSPASGVNRVSVEIIRPPDPTTPSGSGVSIVTGETSVEWLAPDVKLAHTGPPGAGLNQNVVYTTTVRNEGRIDSEWIELTLPVPDGMEFVSSNPPAQPAGGRLTFPFGKTGVGQANTVTTTFRARQAGTVRSIALLRTAEGMTAQAEAITQITAPGLKVELQAPTTGFVDTPVNYTIRVTNTGSGDLDVVDMLANFDPGLEHESIKNPANDKAKNVLSVKLTNVKGGETRNESLTLTPRRPGQFAVRVTATGGGLQEQAQHILTVSQPKVSINVQGPDQRYVGRPAEYKIIVKNDGDVDQTGIVVRDKLPPELTFKLAGNGGTFAAGEVTWNVGTLKPGQQVALDLVADCLKAAPAAEKLTWVTADGNYRRDQSTKLRIDGIAAIQMKMADEVDPVEVGKNAVYRMTLTNTGSAPATKIVVKATASEILDVVDANGPTKATIAGKVVTFGAVDVLQPSQQVVFTFQCRGLKAGDARFRVEYTSSLNEIPIYETEPTSIVPALSNPVPGGGNPPPMPPPPPGGGVPMPLPKN